MIGNNAIINDEINCTIQITDALGKNANKTFTAKGVKENLGTLHRKIGENLLSAFGLMAEEGRIVLENHTPNLNADHYQRYVNAIIKTESNPNEALEDIAKVIKKDKDFARAYQIEGNIYLEQRKMDEAEKSYKKAKEKAKKSPWLKYLYRGVVKKFRQKGHTQNAQTWEKEAITNFPDFGEFAKDKSQATQGGNAIVQQVTHDEKVQKRAFSIDEAIAGKYDTLTMTSRDLSNSSLQGIGKAKHLIKIDLSNNKFSKLPDELYKLPNLRILVLEDNSFSELSDNIEGLSNLEELYLGGNFFKEIPFTISKLTKLKVLSFGYSSFKIKIDKSNKDINWNVTFERIAYLPQKLESLHLPYIQSGLENNPNFKKLNGKLSRLYIYGSNWNNYSTLQKKIKDMLPDVEVIFK